MRNRLHRIRVLIHSCSALSNFTASSEFGELVVQCWTFVLVRMLVISRNQSYGIRQEGLAAKVANLSGEPVTL